MEDKETGEVSFFDRETGETVFRSPHVCLTSTTDAETGEPDPKTVCRRRHFQVPKNLYGDQHHLSHRDQQQLTAAVHRPHNRTHQPVCCIEEKMVSGSQNMSPIVFMLPTLFLFPAWASVLCVVLELCIHMWAHKRNKLHMDNNYPPVWYKSPLQIITSEFCAICKSDKLMHKIGKLQDERKLQVDSKKLRAYMEKVSSIVT